MAKYEVWIGGENPWSRSYTGEYGAIKLTDAQIARWLPDYGKVDSEYVEFDGEAWAEAITSFDDTDDPTDLPNYNEITDGCIGYGAYTDQTVGVAGEDDEIIYSADFSDLWRDEDVEPDHADSVFSWTDNEDHLEGVWIVYNAYNKGGWGTTIELPDDEEFDPSLLKFDVLNVEGFTEICTGFSYNGESYFDDSDTDGKGIDYHLVVDGVFHTIL
jgi:hypothetical protein